MEEEEEKQRMERSGQANGKKRDFTENEEIKLKNTNIKDLLARVPEVDIEKEMQKEGKIKP